MTDCCADKTSARKCGMFEGPVGDEWYICDCQKAAYNFSSKIYRNKRTNPMLKYIFTRRANMFDVVATAAAAFVLGAGDIGIGTYLLIIVATAIVSGVAEHVLGIT